MIKIIGNPKDVQKWLQLKETPLTKYINKALKAGEKGEEPDREDVPTFLGQITEVKGVDGKNLTDYEFNTTKRMYLKGIANEHTMDRMNEIVKPVGLDARNYLKNPIMLADHMYMARASIGRVEELRPEDDGVHFDGWVGDPEKAPLTDMQKDIRSLIAQGILRTVSIGFIPKKIKSPLFNDEGEMVEPAIIEEWEMLELSVIPVPANAGSTFEMKKIQQTYVKHLNEFASLWNNDNVTITSNGKSFNKDNDKGAYEMNEKQAQELIDSMKNLVTLSSSSNEMLKKSLELHETTLSTLEAKGKKPKDDDDDDDKKAFEKRLKTLEDGLAGMTEQLGKLSESVLSLVEGKKED